MRDFQSTGLRFFIFFSAIEYPSNNHQIRDLNTELSQVPKAKFYIHTVLA